jgi:hypothetical protein
MGFYTKVNKENGFMMVYKYLTAARFFENDNMAHYLNGELWFDTVESMNDPLEGHYFLAGDKRGVYSIREEKARYTICATSGTKENVLLWAHYADGHKGLCLGIEVNDNLCTRLQIANDEKRYIKNQNRIFSGNKIVFAPVVYESEELLFKNIEESATEATAILILSAKSNHWSYEKEFRFFKRFSDDIIIKGYHRIGKVKELVLGKKCKFSDDNFREISDFQRTKNLQFSLERANIKYEKIPTVEPIFEFTAP